MTVLCTCAVPQRPMLQVSFDPDGPWGAFVCERCGNTLTVLPSPHEPSTYRQVAFA